MASQRGRTAIESTGVARHGRRWEGLRVRARRRRRCKPRLERLHRRNGRLAQITLSELVAEYLAARGGATDDRQAALAPAKAICAFGDRRVVELRLDEIAAWRTGLPEGHRFEATQALRQVLN